MKNPEYVLASALVAVWLQAASVYAQDAVALDPVQVVGHYETGIGTTDAASAGFITPQLIDDRPLLRPGEVLEYIPGMIVTQHSGAGKGQPVFPARFQSGSRHRLCHHARWHAR